MRTFLKSAVIASSISKRSDRLNKGSFCIAQDRHNQFVKYLAAAGDQIEVPVSRWIERPGIHRNNFLQSASFDQPDGKAFYWPALTEDSMRPAKAMAMLVCHVF